MILLCILSEVFLWARVYYYVALSLDFTSQHDKRYIVCMTGYKTSCYVSKAPTAWSAASAFTPYYIFPLYKHSIEQHSKCTEKVHCYCSMSDGMATRWGAGTPHTYSVCSVPLRAYGHESSLWCKLGQVVWGLNFVGCDCWFLEWAKMRIAFGKTGFFQVAKNLIPFTTLVETLWRWTKRVQKKRARAKRKARCDATKMPSQVHFAKYHDACGILLLWCRIMPQKYLSIKRHDNVWQDSWCSYSEGEHLN